MKSKYMRLSHLTLGVAAACVLAGCAGTNPKDPMEGFNRGMFAFNEGLDKVVIKPVAQGYDAVAPVPVKKGVGNFFSNVADVLVGVNNLLQGKVPDATSDLGRVITNTTVGILGVFDVASEMGLEKHNEDFGQTLGRWGMGPGAYVVLPVFGPRDVRDTIGLVANVGLDPVGRVYPVNVRNSMVGTRLISDRADVLPADKAIEEASLGDKYAYIRDSYLQRRENLVYDGKPPRPKDD
ncbi:MAG: VacJ family lipoprotein [Rhodocyclaceae bacterium]|nr:VacJ family lipoprotein [Rhodocyclaceae bacterium]